MTKMTNERFFVEIINLNCRFYAIRQLVIVCFVVQMLINNLTDVKDQQLLNCEHINATCTALADHVTKVSPTPLYK